MRNVAPLGTIIAALVLASCSEPVSPRDSFEPEPIMYAHPDSVYAALAVLAYANELYPDARLVRRVAGDLKAIRSLTAKPADDIVFIINPWSFWTPGVISLVATQDVVEDIDQGRYHGWDELNARFGARPGGVRRGSDGNGRTVQIPFDAIVHPARLAEEYESLPGVESAYAHILIGDSPSRAYFEFTPKLSRYLFSSGWGDCMAGCMHRDYTFYRVTESRAELVGLLSSGAEAIPDRWDEAQRTMEAFRAGPDGS